MNKRIASLAERGLSSDEYSIDLLADGTELLIEFATSEATEIVRAAATREGLSIEAYVLRLVTQSDGSKRRRDLPGNSETI